MSEKSLKKILGSQVRALRYARGLTQEGIAERLEVTPRYYAGIERGERNLTLDSVDALAAHFGVPSYTLLVEADLEGDRTQLPHQPRA